MYAFLYNVSKTKEILQELRKFQLFNSWAAKESHQKNCILILGIFRFIIFSPHAFREYNFCDARNVDNALIDFFLRQIREVKTSRARRGCLDQLKNKIGLKRINGTNKIDG